MQANDFEKSIKEKMEGFELVPKEEVWKQVSAKIQKEGNKRRVFYWLFGGLFLISVLTAWWFLKMHTTAAITENAAATKDIKAPLKPGSQRLHEPVENKEEDRSTPKRAPSTTNGSDEDISANYQKAGIAKTSIKIKKQPAKSESSLPGVSNTPPGLPTTSGLTINNYVPGAVLKEKSFNLLPHKFLKTGLGEAANDSSESGLIDKDGKKDSTRSIINKKAAVKKDAKQWKMGFTAYAGISNNNAGLPLVSRLSTADYISSGSLNQSSGAVGNISLPVRLEYKTGLSFGLGVFAGKKISRRFGLTAGVGYHFYSAGSTVSNKIDTAATFRDLALQSTAFVRDFYLGGQSGSYLNKWHQIELPLNLQLRLSNNKDNPVSFTAGVSPGLLIGSNALYVNSRERVIYEEKKQFRRFQLSGQAGLLFPLKTFDKLYLNAGPVFQYGFTNLTKPEAAPHQHLLFAGVKANINLK